MPPDMDIIADVAEGITGTPAYGPDDDSDRYVNCASCGQSIDKRDLGQVFHHETAGHKPIKRDA